MSKKIHFFIEYAVHYFKRYLGVIVAGIFFGSFIFIERTYLLKIYRSFQQGDLNIGTEGLYTSANLPDAISGKISYGFTEITENNKPILSPLINQLTIDENNLIYTFTFRDNLFWQNGKKFNPEDIDFKIPGVAITPIQPNKIRIKLDKPYTPILSLLSKPLFLKDTLIGINGKYSAQNLTFQDGYVKQLTLKPNDDDQKIIYHFYSNSQDLINAFKLGEVDEITTTSLDTQITTWPKIRISKNITDQQYLAIFINTNQVDNKQIRQALAYATPKTNDKNSRCLGPISPNSWAYNPEIKTYNYNPIRAKELMPKDSLGTLNLLVTDPKLLDMADKIKQSWEKTLEIKMVTSVANQQIDLSSYDAFLGYGPVPIDPDQYAFWHSTQSKTNVTHLNNSRIDKLLEEGRQVTDQQQRKNIYYDFQRFLLEESPAIFLEFPTTYTISRIK